MSYIFSICLLTSQISVSLETDISVSGSPCLTAHLPPTALKCTKNNKTLNSGFDHYFLLKLSGAAVLFVQAYHLKGLGQEVKKICPTQIPREIIEHTKILGKKEVA